MATCPPEVRNLVERFARNREALRSSAYNETQARREFIDPLFTALGWDVDETSDIGAAPGAHEKTLLQRQIDATDRQIDQLVYERYGLTEGGFGSWKKGRKGGDYMDPLHDLEKWQATSHPGLSAHKPDELFLPDFAERYGRLHSDLWERVVRLHSTIRALEQLEPFPFYFVYGPNNMEFWHLVIRNFVEMAVVLLHSLLNDQADDSHTMIRFRNEIMRADWLDEGMRDVLRRTLKERAFDKKVESLAERVGQIRHRIVHRLIDAQTGHPKGRLAGVSLTELRDLFDATHSLFGALSFGSSYVTLAGDLIPATIGGKPRRTSVDEVLDAVVRDSAAVRQPESQRQWWPDIRKYVPTETLNIMNELRRRVGLPEA